MIVIHIGLKKAGSSTLQNFCSKNRKAFLAHSIVYPPIGYTANAHKYLAQEIVKFGKSAKTPRLVYKLVRYWRTSDKSTLLLSSEVFEGAAAEGTLFLRDRLTKARRREPIRIVMILRDLVDLIPSSYAQKIKFGDNTYDFDAFFALRMKEKRVNYFETASRWASAFGWKNMIVRPLDSQHLRNGNLVDDVFHILGIDINADDYKHQERVAIRNTRPGWRVIEAVRALYSGNHGLPQSHLALKALAQIGEGRTLGVLAMQVGSDLGWNEDHGRYLSRAQAQECSDVYRAAIDRLNEYLTRQLPAAPPDLETRNFVAREFMPDVQAISRPELSEFYERLAASWLSAPANVRKISRYRENRHRDKTDIVNSRTD